LETSCLERLTLSRFGLTLSRLERLTLSRLERLTLSRFWLLSRFGLTLLRFRLTLSCFERLTLSRLGLTLSRLWLTRPAGVHSFRLRRMTRFLIGRIDLGFDPGSESSDEELSSLSDEELFSLPFSDGLGSSSDELEFDDSVSELEGSSEGA